MMDTRADSCKLADYEINRLPIRLLSVTATKRLLTALSLLDSPTSLHGDYRNLGENLLGLSMHDLNVLENQAGSQGYSARILEAWQRREPHVDVGTLRNTLRSIERYDVEIRIAEIVKDSYLESTESSNNRRHSYHGYCNRQSSETRIPMEFSPEPCTMVTSGDLAPRVPADCIQVTDTQLRETMTSALSAYSARTEGRLVFYCRLLLVALSGILEAIHTILRSNFYDPIDYSTWSMFFLVVCMGKEVCICILVITSPAVVGTVYSTVHVYLLSLLLVQVVHDKAVSPPAKEMRQYFLHMLYLSNICHTDLYAHCCTETEHRQTIIRRYFHVFLALQSALILLLRVQTMASDWHAVHEVVHYWCMIAYLGKVGVYLCHYRYTGAHLLHGRFKIDTDVSGRNKNYSRKIYHV